VFQVWGDMASLEGRWYGFPRSFRFNQVSIMYKPRLDLEHDERYQQEYRKMLSGYARMVVENPDIVDQLREAVQTSAQLIMSNRPETVTEFQRLAEELDAFLVACKNGEIDPKKFLMD